MNTNTRPALEDFKAPVKLKLSAFWASVMFLYVYGDYFNMYTPGKINAMAAGELGVGPATPGVLLAVAALMAVPSVMILLSLLLPPFINRWLNVVLGLAYSAIMLITMPGAPMFYIFLGVLEIALTLLIAWFALNWPRRPLAA
ncbi:MAG: DUF6326 family protein [Caulobacteraceae bacterium]